MMGMSPMPINGMTGMSVEYPQFPLTCTLRYSLKAV
jgi:hypothetical protein